MAEATVPSFNSSMASVLYDFVEYKRDSGYKYNSEVKVLQRLDRFLVRNDILEVNSDSDFSDWLNKREDESFKSFSLRNTVYRQLYEYTVLMKNTVLPVPLAAKDRTMNSGFVPYIFTHEQINAFFYAIDHDDHTSSSFKENASFLFRLLYGTGLRINEALSLTVADVSPDYTLIMVRDGKYDNSRIVPLSRTLTERMKEHLVSASYNDEDPIFQSSNGTAVKKNCAYDWFRRELWKAEIPHYGRGKGPRLHDLRHTFAVHSLQRAVETGVDINAFLPLLCAYLGHQRLASTERYLRLTAEVFPEVINATDSIMNAIVPEVTNHEN